MSMDTPTEERIAARCAALDRKVLFRLVPFPAEIAILYLSFVLACVAFGFKPSADGSYWTFGNVSDAFFAGLYLAVIGLHFHRWRKYIKEYPLRLLVADESVWVAFLAAAFLNGFFLSGYENFGGGFGEFRMGALPGGVALLVLFLAFGVLHHQRVGKYPAEAFRKVVKAASAGKSPAAGGTEGPKQAAPLPKAAAAKERIAARCAALSEKEIARLCLAPVIAVTFSFFDIMSVLVGFRADGDSLWILFNFIEAALAGGFLWAIAADFRYYRKYLREEYPLWRLAGDEAFRILLLAAAFLNGFFFTVYTPLPDGWEVAMTGWPGGLALFILCVCFEFVYHYKKVWEYPQRVHQRNWMG